MKELLPEIEQLVRSHPQFLQLKSQSVAQQPSRVARLCLFFNVIEAIPLAKSMWQAKSFMDSTLNAIEDEFSGAAYCPENWMTDGRMYPAGEDYRRRMPTDDVACYFHKGHATYFGVNGSIRISERRPVSPKVLLERPGEDGLSIGDLLELSSKQVPRSGP